ALLRLMAPILSFTAEEGWWHLPDQPSATIHLEDLPEPKPLFRNGELSQRWEKLLLLRSEVLRALEIARQAKIIGHPLDAVVRLSLPLDLQKSLEGQEELLRAVFIVSGVSISDGEALTQPLQGEVMEGLLIEVAPASGGKCGRCWVRTDAVGRFSDHPDLCDRCHGVITGEN
ncbi:MAG: class I tRNA ligase family protein, partial [Syntrophobacteraceae bacterium]|nr:class I tRNA ligase family protein [Syntrophobacteraceae bacterium]